MHSVLAAASMISDDAMVLISQDGRILDGNPRFLTQYGYQDAEVAGLTVADLRSELDEELWFEEWAGLATGGPATYEAEHRTKDGRVFPVEVSLKPIEIDGQSLLAAVLHDIGERAESRVRLERMTRLYEAVSASNRAVIFSKDEQEMFARICGACTDYGMRMAWIGLRDGDKILPAHFSGAGGEYLGGIVITVGGDDTSAKGPTGMAALTGQHMLCNDFQNDPRTQAWHDRGRTFGWRASAAFPLFRGGQVLGTLTMYSEHRDYFGEEETRLIDELAKDVSFALDRFEADRERKRLESELKLSRLNIVHSLGRAGEYRDNETGAHILRMSHFCRILAEAAGHPGEFAEMLLHASPMHDVGKIGIPDSILLKPGKLDVAEFEVMKTHVLIGAEILSISTDPLVAMAKSIALTHHEKWDGSGYPHGLTGDAIPLEGRIAAICDVYDALTSHRPYKQAWSQEDATNYIRTGAGSHFDPDLAQCFLGQMEVIGDVQKRFMDRG